MRSTPLRPPCCNDVSDRKTYSTFDIDNLLVTYKTLIEMYNTFLNKWQSTFKKATSAAKKDLFYTEIKECKQKARELLKLKPGVSKDNLNVFTDDKNELTIYADFKHIATITPEELHDATQLKQLLEQSDRKLTDYYNLVTTHNKGRAELLAIALSTLRDEFNIKVKDIITYINKDYPFRGGIAFKYKNKCYRIEVNERIEFLGLFEPDTSTQIKKYNTETIDCTDFQYMLNRHFKFTKALALTRAFENRFKFCPYNEEEEEEEDIDYYVFDDDDYDE